VDTTETTPRRNAARWSRRDDAFEFERAGFFTDAVFAIAMTLLVVAIAVPTLRHASSSSDLLDALDGKASEIVAFFIGFSVLGNYWLANHRFLGYLDGVSSTFLGVMLVYLGCVAWLPFPTALLGAYVENPIAVVLFAASASAVSGLEAILLRRSVRDGLFHQVVPQPAYRFALRASLLPIAFFVLSVPLAFVSTAVAISVWFLTFPGELLLERWKPASYDETFGRGPCGHTDDVPRSTRPREEGLR
jgi:uncharacterized membrane protein